MRLRAVFAAMIAAVAIVLVAPQPADAGGLFRDRAAHGDPYAYRYEPRGYYPYYNSRYWKPAHVMRKKRRKYHKQAPYYQAWGYPKRHYNHREWHAKHHGRHWIGHW